MSARILLVDTEATSPSPFSGVMTEFGIVDLVSRATFHGVLYDSMPSPLNPAIPVLAGHGPGPRYQRDTDTAPVLMRDARGRSPVTEDDGRVFVMGALIDWLDGFEGRPQFWSDNPGYDFMWMAYEFDQCGVGNPFGFSSRRIGDLAAGLKGKFRDTSSWKRYRKTKHTHNPVDDSMGNAEALATILSKHGQQV